jgi:hypothetical protein
LARSEVMHYPDATGGWIFQKSLCSGHSKYFVLITSILITCAAILMSSRDRWTAMSCWAVPNVRPMTSLSNGQDDVKNTLTDRWHHLHHNLRLRKGVFHGFLNIRASCTCRPIYVLQPVFPRVSASPSIKPFQYGKNVTPLF